MKYILAGLAVITALVIVLVNTSGLNPFSTTQQVGAVRTTTDAQDIYLQVSNNHLALIMSDWLASMNTLHEPDNMVKVITGTPTLMRVTFTCSGYEQNRFTCYPFPGTQDGEVGVFHISARDMDTLFQTGHAVGILLEDK